MDIKPIMDQLESQHGVPLRVRGFWAARLLLMYLAVMLPLTEKLPAFLRVPDEVAERRLRWALTYMVVEAYTGDDRWVVVANGWDHVRQAA